MHPFATYIQALGRGKKGARSLSESEAYDAFLAILNNTIEPIQLGAFLMLLRVKEETPEELAGFVRACRSAIHAPTDTTVDIDWPSYAGKRKQPPWFVLSLLCLADAGYTILVHGVQGHTPDRLYTEQVFDGLSLPKSNTWPDVSGALATNRLSYLPIERMHPVLGYLLRLKPTLGLRSPVHTLCRLINPLSAKHSFQSVFHPAYAQKHQAAAHLLGQQSMAVFKGEGGEIERNPEANTLVKSLYNGVSREHTWPRLLPKQVGQDAPVVSIDSLRQIWRAEHDDTYAYHAVIATMAIVLGQIHPELSQDDLLDRAKQHWQARNPTRC